MIILFIGGVGQHHKRVQYIWHKWHTRLVMDSITINDICTVTHMRIEFNKIAEECVYNNNKYSDNNNWYEHSVSRVHDSCIEY